ncbi:IMPACT family protein [Paenimyroides aestuarii]|uniref:YigZ family protein n=1 Tax=Paenimyroides aestuarii TaxID=2968490 RepID=A0ABY5NSC6_9FLAO|nr:YigZ family protein [Paenimyroides aestuarii]UUV21473.1 YigZ family protein [Paenimyroides aestuarii]
MIDTYKTIEKPSDEVLFKEKNSKFFGYAFPVRSENEVKEVIDQLKKQHHAARHWCYAYQIGTKTKNYRANDDGEPNNSAGMPIYGQIQSFDVTNVLVVVVRYFGGVKLGVGGLITAYKTGAQMALEASEIVEKTINTHFFIRFDYKNMNKVMRVIKEKNLNIERQVLELDCLIEISCRLTQKEEIFNAFHQFFEVSITEKED